MCPDDRRQVRLWRLAVLVGLVVVGGCGGDGDEEDSLESIPERTELREYCDAWAPVEQAIEDPAVAAQLAPEQLDRLTEVAPSELSEEIDVVVDGLRQAQDGDTGALESSAFEDARQHLKEYRTKLETEGDAPCEQGVGELDG